MARKGCLIGFGKLWLVLGLILAIFSHISSCNNEPASPEQAPLYQAEYVAEVRESIVVLAANSTEVKEKSRRPCRGNDLFKEKKSLLQRIKKPKLAVNYPVHHIRYRLLSAIDGFQKYADRAEGILQTKRDMFQGLNGDQQKVHFSTCSVKEVANYGATQLVNKVASYQDKLSSTFDGLKRNAQIAQNIADYALVYYGIHQHDVDTHLKQLTSEGKSSDHTSVSQALKHFVRDWSEDGTEERDASFPQILETLQEMFPERSDNAPIKILIPGSGVGRLAHSVDDLTGKSFP